YPGAEYAPYQTVMTLFTARRAEYSLEIEDSGAFLQAAIPEPHMDYGMGMAQQQFSLASRGKLQTAGRPLLRAGQGQWVSSFYSYQGHMALEGGGAGSNLSAAPTANGINSLSGTFTLNLPHDMKACQIIGPGGYKQDVG
ncbi:MAG: hypothetical protein M3R04_02635, partial [bacterium]|nr:hypothetical protein [bacterium]